MHDILAFSNFMEFEMLENSDFSALATKINHFKQFKQGEVTLKCRRLNPQKAHWCDVFPIEIVSVPLFFTVNH